MELLTKASVLEHLMRGPHHRGIRLLPAEVAVFDWEPPAGQVNPRLVRPSWSLRHAKWLDRDTNGCLNLQRIGESRQRPIELCRWDDLEALLPIGKEYQQRCKLVNDRLPKGRQWLHRAAEYRRGIDGRARNNA
ncbi:hypothetical protein HaLaN_07441 [Haematococcus lacustris]|uniref:Uncharacterized protein n=1 Tax=Haematococcus lacustris TaxID=44745 RepID=A0A699YNL7_HAELA|nr:hypothetical protein HaLaN_07441 [Haematococcus lacustris]